METINLNGAPVSAAVLAMIAEYLDRFGEVTVIGAAVANRPGQSAMSLGRVLQAGMEALKDAS